MTQDGPEATPDGAEAPEGVFGNLPSSRPGSRSPRRKSGSKPSSGAESDAAEATPSASESQTQPTRRDEARARADEEAERSAAAAAESGGEGESPATGEGSPRTGDGDPLAPPAGIKGVEDLAWAGVAVMAQAATAGIRFTSKALEAARKSIDRP